MTDSDVATIEEQQQLLKAEKQGQFQELADETETVGVVEVPEEERVKLASDEEEPTGFQFSWKKLWAFTGPGWLMSIAYLDPGNLESDLQAGAVAGYKLIWVLFWATVLGYLLQLLSARLGTATGRNMAELCRGEYPKRVSIALWLMAELAIIGSDIQEVIGSAIALNLLFKIPLWGGVLITACDSFTFLFLNFFGVRKLEAFFGALILTMGVSFGIMFFIGKPQAVDIAYGLTVPTIPKGALSQAVGMLGAVIMPHNLFLHSALVQTRKIDRSSKRKIEESNYYFAIESAVSLIVSFTINMFIVTVFAVGFYVNNTPNTDIGLFEAGQVLENRFGKLARTMWAIGLLASGQSSTMTGTFAGQFVMQGFLNLQIKPWQRTTITRLVAIVPTMIVAVSLTKKLDTFDQFLNVLQSIQLPFAVIPLVTFSSSVTVVGNFRLGPKLKFFFWTVVTVIVGTNIYLVIDTFRGLTLPIWGYVIVALVGVVYLGFVTYLVLFKTFREPRRLTHHYIARTSAAETTKLLSDK